MCTHLTYNGLTCYSLFSTSPSFSLPYSLLYTFNFTLQGPMSLIRLKYVNFRLAWVFVCSCLWIVLRDGPLEKWWIRLSWVAWIFFFPVNWRCKNFFVVVYQPFFLMSARSCFEYFFPLIFRLPEFFLLWAHPPHPLFWWSVPLIVITTFFSVLQMLKHFLLREASFLCDFALRRATKCIGECPLLMYNT